MRVLYKLISASTLKGQLRLWAGALIVTMCVLIVLSMSVLVKTIKEQEVHSALQEAIDLQRLFVDKWRSERMADIEYLAGLPETRAQNLSEIRRLFELFRGSNRDFDSVSYVNAEGKLSMNMSGLFDLDVSDRDFFKAAQQNQSFITDVIVSRSTGKNMLAFSAPVLDERNQFAGAIVGSVDLKTLDNMMNHFRLGESGESFLLNKEGFRMTKLLEDTAGQHVNEKYHTEIYKRALTGVRERSSYLNHEGVQVFGAYAWSESKQWLLVGETRTSEVYGPYYELLLVMGIITFLILSASYVAAILFTRKTNDLLHYLLQGTKQIRAGQYGFQIDPSMIQGAPKELRELSDNFNIMSSRLQTTVQLLEESAVIDHLTEVYNRRFLMNEGAKIEEAAARAGNPSCILLIDVDFFKQVNDSHGHLVGDRVLKHAASLLVACVRNSDVVARYGGEEFVVLATNCSLERGGELAERIRTWFMSSPYRDEEREIPMTVSIGVAQSVPSRQFGTNTLEDMIERADKALYRAKHNGRNRVECDPGSL